MNNIINDAVRMSMKYILTLNSRPVETVCRGREDAQKKRGYTVKTKHIFISCEAM